MSYCASPDKSRRGGERQAMETENKRAAGGRIAILASALMWGLAGICVKEIDGWPTTSIVAVRSAISLIMLIVAKLVRDRTLRIKLSWRNIAGGAAAAATGILYVQSIKMTTAGTAIVLQYIAPILVFLFAVIFRHKKVRLAEALITLCVFGGIILSFADSLDPSRITGNLLGLLSGFTFAAQIIILNGDGSEPIDSMIISCTAALIFSLPFAFSVGPEAVNTHNLVWLAVLGVFQYGMGNLLFALGIKKTDGVEASLLLTLEPIFNPIPVAIFYGERMGTLALIGSAVVIVFVTLYGLLPVIRKKMQKA